MELYEAIYTRRSVRKYQNRAVPDALIRKILGAAMMAPSAGNEQPWQFVVITDRNSLHQLRKIHPYIKMVSEAPLGILVCGDLRLEKYAGFWVQDCCASMQNLLLAAHSEGLGAVWTGIYPYQERVEPFKAMFKLPDDVIPLGLTLIGWPAHEYRRKNRFKPDRIHREYWKG